jgi:hypothetical protein
VQQMPGRDAYLDGLLAADFRRTLGRSTWSYNERPRMYAARNGLDVLRVLNDLNKRGGKHLSGDEITWEDVVNVRAGLYWALRALIDVASNPPIAVRH